MALKMSDLNCKFSALCTRVAPSGQLDSNQQSAADLHGGTAHGVTSPAADTVSCCWLMCVLFLLLLLHGTVFTVVM